MKRSRKNQIKLAYEGALGVFNNGKYVLLFLILVVVCMQILYWFLNLGLAQYLLFSDLSAGDKLTLFGSALTSLVRGANTLQGAAILVLVVLQAVAFTLLTYALRHQAKMEKRALGGTMAGAIGSIFGLGCAACGTSLVMPIVALFFSSASYMVADTVGTIITLFAIALVLYSIYRLGYSIYPQIANHR